MRAHVVAFLLVAALAAPTVAQEAGPSAEPMPYGAYSAALEGFSAASASMMDDLGPTPAVSDVTAAYRQSLAHVKKDQLRLLRVVPEPCYAAAHDEIFAYRQSGIELLERTLPLMARAGSLADLRELLEAVDRDLYLRHPIAYVDGPDAGEGFGGSPYVIATAMVTCDDREPPWLAGRVDMPEHRFGLTLPAGWIGIDMDGPVDRQLTAAIERLDAESRRVHKADVRAAIARSEGLADRLVIVDTATGDSCGFVGGPNRTGAELDSLGEQFLESFAGDPTVTEVQPLRDVDLPIGPAVRIQLTIDDANRPFLSGPATAFLVVAEDRIVLATCSAPLDPPEDRWLSIAESFRLLPEPTGG